MKPENDFTIETCTDSKLNWEHYRTVFNPGLAVSIAVKLSGDSGYSNTDLAPYAVRVVWVDRNHVMWLGTCTEDQITSNGLTAQFL